MTDILLPTDAGYDNPDSRDYEYQAIMGDVRQDKEKFVLHRDELIIHNQGLDERTRNGCGGYSITHLSNAQNLRERKKYGISFEQKDPKEYWIRWNLNARPEDSRRRGSSIQQHMANFRDGGLISGRAKVMSVEDGKNAIDNGHLISTGSRNGDWRNVRNNGWYRQRNDGRIVGHLFPIVSYDDTYESFIALNSYGPEDGYFFIPYKLYSTLYTRYAIFDVKDKDIILQYKAKMEYNEMFELAVSLGITNGDRPKEDITREEVAVMLGRLYKLLDDKQKKFLEQLEASI